MAEFAIRTPDGLFAIKTGNVNLNLNLNYLQQRPECEPRIGDTCKVIIVSHHYPKSVCSVRSDLFAFHSKENISRPHQRHLKTCKNYTSITFGDFKSF